MDLHADDDLPVSGGALQKLARIGVRAAMVMGESGRGGGRRNQVETAEA